MVPHSFTHGNSRIPRRRRELVAPGSARLMRSTLRTSVVRDLPFLFFLRVQHPHKPGHNHPGLSPQYRRVGCPKRGQRLPRRGSCGRAPVSRYERPEHAQGCRRGTAATQEGGRALNRKENHRRATHLHFPESNKDPVPQNERTRGRGREGRGLACRPPPDQACPPDSIDKPPVSRRRSCFSIQKRADYMNFQQPGRAGVGVWVSKLMHTAGS